MTAPLIDLLTGARRAGLILAREADGKLVIRGPRGHEQLVKSLLARKPDVLPLVAIYVGDVTCLDWRGARVLDTPRPCVLCRRPALLVEPYDHRPCHRTCAEAAITPPATIPAARTGRAA